MGTEPAARTEPPVRTSLRFLWLIGLVYGVASAIHPGTNGRHLTALVLTVTTGVSWAGWLWSRHRRNLAVSVASMALLAASGGGMTVLNPFGVVVVGLAGMCAASLLELVPAAALSCIGVVAAAIAVAASGHDPIVIGSAASGAAAGIAVGLGRRQQQERVRQDAELALARERSDVEHQRAEVLAERNRLAREVHDVLAHTLSALSVQMEALDSLLTDGGDSVEAREVVRRSRRLVVGGLQEARQAVHALRDEPVAVSQQVEALAADAGADFRVEGQPRPLTAAQGLALVRVVQEALTNIRKHAPGAATEVTLRFTESAVHVVVANAGADAPSSLADTGGGYGLRGMRERMELLGGSLTAGPTGSGWTVHAELPT